MTLHDRTVWTEKNERFFATLTAVENGDVESARRGICESGAGLTGSRILDNGGSGSGVDRALGYLSFKGWVETNPSNIRQHPYLTSAKAVNIRKSRLRSTKRWQ